MNLVEILSLAASIITIFIFVTGRTKISDFIKNVEVSCEEHSKGERENPPDYSDNITRIIEEKKRNDKKYEMTKNRQNNSLKNKSRTEALGIALFLCAVILGPFVNDFNIDPNFFQGSILIFLSILTTAFLCSAVFSLFKKGNQLLIKSPKDK